MTLYEDIKKGLEEAIAYNEGRLAARKTTLSNDPEIPNATTIAAIEESRKIAKDPSCRAFDSVEELKKALFEDSD